MHWYYNSDFRSLFSEAYVQVSDTRILNYKIIIIVFIINLQNKNTS